MRHVFRTTAVLPLARPQVFAFFAAAENLQRLTPAELDFRILTPLPIEMRAGTLIRYRLRLAGIPFEWVTRISVWNPPSSSLTRIFAFRALALRKALEI